MDGTTAALLYPHRNALSLYGVHKVHGGTDGRTDGTTAALLYPYRDALRGDNKDIFQVSSQNIEYIEFC